MTIEEKVITASINGYHAKEVGFAPAIPEAYANESFWLALPRDDGSSRVE